MSYVCKHKSAEMKVIIAGSRNITEYAVVIQAIKESFFDITEVVSGGARGVDSLGEQFAGEYAKDFKLFPADWAALGKKAGYVRNTQMAKYAEALIAIWDGQSKGTEHMINQARQYGLQIYIKMVTNEN